MVCPLFALWRRVCLRVFARELVYLRAGVVKGWSTGEGRAGKRPRPGIRRTVRALPRKSQVDRPPLFKEGRETAP